MFGYRNYRNKGWTRFFSTSAFNPRFQTELHLINPHPVKQLENSYLFSNERGWPASLKQLQIKANNQENNIVLMTGESHIFSVLPFLSKQIIVNDIDLDVHAHIKLMHKLLLTVDGKEEFISNYFHLLRENNFDDLAYDKYHFHKILKERSELLGEIDFLSTQKRYSICQQAAKNSIFYYSHFDYFNAQQVEEFSNLLKQHQYSINLCNISNLQDYQRAGHASLLSNLRMLVNPQTLIMHSAFCNNVVKALSPILFAEFENKYSNSVSRNLSKYNY